MAGGWHGRGPRSVDRGGGCGAHTTEVNPTSSSLETGDRYSGGLMIGRRHLVCHYGSVSFELKTMT